jgi:NO-binding membrane sensor protein with MHYT domain
MPLSWLRGCLCPAEGQFVCNAPVTVVHPHVHLAHELCSYTLLRRVMLICGICTVQWHGMAAVVFQPHLRTIAANNTPYLRTISAALREA